MSWAKVDDHFWSHPKVVATSDEALGLWVRALSYVAQHETDGFLASSGLAIVQPEPRRRKRLAEELVSKGLWRLAPGGYLFHDYLERNPSRDQLKQQRTSTAARMRKWRSNRPGDGVTHGVTHAVSDAFPDPTRPVKIYASAKKHQSGPVGVPSVQATRAMLRAKGLG